MASRKDRHLRAESFNRHGIFLYRQGRYKEALANFDKAIANAPDDAFAFFNVAITKLLLGKYKEGWRLYEWRWRRKDLSSETFSKPLWLGHESLTGKTILLHAEQGFGDTIQFCRYAALAAERGATVVLQVQESLASLISTLRHPCCVVPQGQSLPEFDFHCPLMSLPLAFGTTSVDEIPANVPYLYVDAENRRMWEQRLGNKSRIRVGLCWSGEPGNPNDKNRSIPAHMLMPLLELNCEFHSVQKGIKAEDAEFLKASAIRPHDNQLHGFLDAASLVSEMDVIVCVDTAVAHLSGALGKPTWIMLPFAPDFRWLTEREESPWYPTARLFRQQKVGDWHSVIANVSEQLKLLFPPALA